MIEQIIGIAGLSKEVVTIKKMYERDDVYLITFSTSMTRTLEIAQRLFETGLCEFSSPSFKRLIKPHNTYQFFQWGLHNSGQYGGISGIDIKMSLAWNITKGNPNIKIAVLDEGVQFSHPDLCNNLLPGYDVTINYGQVPSGPNGSPLGHDAHGTFCAGVIGAMNNTIGVIGIAPDCRIIPIRMAYHLHATDEHWTFDDDWTTSAIETAWATVGADVINCSWGGGSTNPNINTAINHATAWGRNGLGCVVVFATGNDKKSTINYPSSQTDVIAVGAINNRGQRASFSNYGTGLDVVAPGVDIYTTDLQGSAGSNKSNGTLGDYCLQSGTSLACPHVAGIAALILSVRPDLNQLQVRQAIESTCTKINPLVYTYSNNSAQSNGTWNNEVGYGLVNAYAAVNSVAPRISGPNFVCNDGTDFSFNYAPNGFTWTHSNNITLQSSSGNQATFTPEYTETSDIGWIGIALNGTTIAKKDVWVGPPYLVDVTGADVTYVGNTERYQAILSSDYLLNVTFPTWSITPWDGYEYWTEYSDYLHHWCDIIFYEPGPYTIEVEVSNACGANNYLYRKDIYVYNSYYYSAYPNPASSILNIDLDHTAIFQAKASVQTTTDGKQLKREKTYDIRLYDNQGNMLRQRKAKGGKVEFNVASLPNGIYYLHIYDGVNEKPEMRQIVVQH